MATYPPINFSSTLFFVSLIALSFVLIALRMLFDYFKMKDKAIDLVKELSFELNNFKKETSRDDNFTLEFLSKVQKFESQRDALSKQIDELNQKLSKESIFSRVNTGTGDWMTITRQAKLALETFKIHRQASALEYELTRYDQPTNMED